MFKDDLSVDAAPFDPLDHLNARDRAEVMRDAWATGDPAVIQAVQDMIARHKKAGIARIRSARPG